MIPKVASHILQHTSRAAAAVQAQTTQSLRNALQYQSTGQQPLNSWSSTPGSSSSGWGSTGGAKNNAGGKFYTQTQHNSAVNQANSASSHNAGADEHDDLKKRITVLRRQPAHLMQPASRSARPRSSSYSAGSSLLSRSDLTVNTGVLEAVRSFYAVRHRHALIEAANFDQDDVLDLPQSPRQSVRRNSMSSASVESIDDRPLEMPQMDEPVASASEADQSVPAQVEGVESIDSEVDSLVDDMSASAVESTEATDVSELDLGFADGSGEGFDPILLQELRYALSNRNLGRVDSLMRKLRATGPLNTTFYNIALRAAAATRNPGQPIGSFVGVYNEMLTNSVRPDDSTYRILISTFCERDFEVYCALQSVEGRETRRKLLSKVDTENQAMDNMLRKRLEHEREVHFKSACELFNIVAPRFWRMGMSVYTNLLRSCSIHGEVDQAIKVYAHLERHQTKGRLVPSIYYYLIGAYMKVRDVYGAQEVFAEYKAAAARGEVFWARSMDKEEPGQFSHQFAENARAAHIRVYNRMIQLYMSCGQPEQAISLLEHMLSQNNGVDFGPQDVPPPNTRTFTTLIEGFVEANDLDSALAWHTKLMQQEAGPATDSEMAVLAPTRPSAAAWETILEALALGGDKHIDTLNALWLDFTRIAPVDGIDIRSMDKHIVLEANIRSLAELTADSPRHAALTEFVLRQVIPVESSVPEHYVRTGNVMMWNSYASLVKILAQAQRPDDALESVRTLVHSELALAQFYETKGTISADVIAGLGRSLRHLVRVTCDEVVQHCGDQMTLLTALNLASLRSTVSLAQRHEPAIITLRAYAALSPSNLPPLSSHQWDMLFTAAVSYQEWKESASDLVQDIPPPDYVRLLNDYKNQDTGAARLPSRRRFVSAMITALSLERTREIIDAVFPVGDHRGEAFRDVLSNRVAQAQRKAEREGAPEPVVAENAESANIMIDIYHTRIVEEYYPSHPTLTVHDGYKRFEQGMLSNIYPTPEAIGHLIGALGRIGEMDKVRTLYNAGQAVLASLESKDKQWQSFGWFQIEDQMIIAFAHSGDVAAAQIHRQRILQYRGRPTPDAYGALISATKDTTDDVAPALALWEESQTLGVRPNIYLYNTIISKLAKARKVDHALALFSKMKQQGIRPSSVTYGAMISACARVGDAISAEHLFQEMSTMNNYKPRIPPFNTMMQMYTYTIPDRSRVLWYYEQLLAASIRPNAHTYKILMDSYGQTQPLDFGAMENVFLSLCNDSQVPVSGSHWSSLINAYGCIGGDIDRAIAVFESVAGHPSSLRNPRPMPDAVVYEALINVFVTQHRMDLAEPYIQRLQADGIHMTAYVANLLIKGHAATGGIEQARAVFESLHDPPDGIAAPNNHVPHGAAEVVTPQPSASAPVYREPSTWEAMVRAELGFGDAGRVDGLLQRMETRRYPPGVINRVRGILSGNDIPELGAPITNLYPGSGTTPASASYFYSTTSPGSPTTPGPSA